MPLQHSETREAKDVPEQTQEGQAQEQARKAKPEATTDDHAQTQEILRGGKHAPEHRDEGDIPGVGKRTQEVAIEGKGDIDDEREYTADEINKMPTPEALRASGAVVGDPTKGPAS